MQHIDKPLYIIGISTIATNNPEGFNKIGELWNNFFQSSIAEQLSNKISPNIFSVYSDYENGYKGNYKITIGYAVTDINDIPEGLKSITIPAGKYRTYLTKSPAPEDILATWQEIWTLDPEQFPRTFIADFQEHTEDKVMISVGYKN
jgi:predicted transcriptional regulator YdeE